MTVAANDLATAETTQLLARLVAVQSYSGDELAVQREIIAWFAENGIEAILEKAEGGLHNVVVTVEGAGPGPVLFLGGHCDTVSPAPDYSFDPHAPEIRDGRLYGLGSMDMKSGLATAMIVVRDLAASRDSWRGSLIFAALADEEAYSRGANGFVVTGRRIDGAIMCEPHFSNPAIGSIGKINLHVAVHGKSAHGSHPAEGISAVTAAARLIAAIDTLPRRAHPLYGKGTHCVLNVSSGARRYEIRVPDFCEFLVNWHFMPGETAEEAVATFDGLARKLGGGARVEVTIRSPRYDTFELKKDHPFVALFAESYRRAIGKAPGYEFCFGVSDANIFNAAGIPTLLFGPGGANMHAADEWADLHQMTVARDLFADVARQFLAREE